MACGDIPNNGRGCYIGCTCKAGWSSLTNSLAEVNTIDGTQKSTAAAANPALTSNTLNKSAASTKSGISTMAVGDACTISLTDPRYGTTCSKQSTLDCAGTCGGNAYFSCPSGYSLSICAANEIETGTKKQQCSSGSATNSTTCHACRKKTCSEGGYYSSTQDGMNCTSASYNGYSCFSCTKVEDCYYTVSVTERNGNTSSTKVFVASLDSNKWSHPAISVTIRIWVNTQSGSGSYRKVTATIPVGSQTGSGSLTLSSTDDFFSDWYIESVSPSSYDYGNGTTCTVSF